MGIGVASVGTCIRMVPGAGWGADMGGRTVGWLDGWLGYTLIRMAFSMGVSDAMVESRRRDAALV